MIYDCRLLLRALKEYKLKHVYREANAVAVLLAKHRPLENTRSTLFYQPPSFLVLMFSKKILCTLYLRKISSCNLPFEIETHVIATDLLL